MSAATDTLGTDDYAALHALQMSSDPAERAQAATLAQKLTPSERSAFFDYQQQAYKDAGGGGERTRQDASLLGMPPELAVASAVPIARAVAGAGASLASKAAAGAAAAGPQVAAQAKFWATKALLTKMGVPPVIAEGIAIVASGYKKGAKGEAAAEPVSAPAAAAEMPPTAGAPPPSAAPVAPPATGPAAPGPPAAPGAPAAAPPPMPEPPVSGPTNTLPDQKALNEAALARRRAEYQARQAATPPPAAPAKPKLTNPEMVAFLKLIQQGKTPSEAYAALEAQRAFQSQFGLSTPTADQTRFQKGTRGGRPSL